MADLLKILIVWASIDVVVITSGFYMGNVVRVHFPNWWKQIVCDDYPITAAP